MGRHGPKHNTKKYYTYAAHMVNPTNNGPIVSPASCAGHFALKVSSASKISGCMVVGILAKGRWKRKSMATPVRLAIISRHLSSYALVFSRVATLIAMVIHRSLFIIRLLRTHAHSVNLYVRG